MKISEFIDLLELYVNEHGDLPIVLEDADTGWYWLLRPEHLQVYKNHLVIGGSYSDENISLEKAK